jgi:hypothetical protein
MPFPILNELLARVPESNRAAHPLTSLAHATDVQGERRAWQSEDALARARNLFPDYAKEKERLLVAERQSRNASGILGEFRALGELSYVFGSNIQTPKSGSDFLVTVGDRQLRVEVTTSAGSTKNTLLDSETRQIGNVRVRTTSTAPFGYPTEDKPQDRIQGNAVSRLSALKQGEHQADLTIPTVLWVDFGNPHAFPISIGASQAQPFLGGRESLVSGVLWWMNYGQKGDPIFDMWELTTAERQFYALEFDARFPKGSQFVGVVCAIDDQQILHENYLTGRQLSSDWIVELLQLRGARLENWWVDWPSRGNLSIRVELARAEAHALLAVRYPAHGTSS